MAFDLTVLAAAAFLTVQLGVIAFLLASVGYQIHLMRAYRRQRGPDAPPKRRFSEDDLPRVTVQLPVRNEGATFERCLRAAAALEYPVARLEIQVLDDSDDGATSERIDRVATELRRKRKGLDIRCVRREGNEDFKAGILRLGMEKASGEFFAIFDADFVVPPDFLSRTLHYFTEPDVAAVQGRWAFLNRNESILTRVQAARTDAHQMFEQTARHALGRMVAFHGTAGIWRASALAAAGGWTCISEVEDVEVSIRSFNRGGRIVYLDHLRVPSELPSTMRAYLVQQMRWKRGWTRLALHYSGAILRSPARRIERLDLLQRLHLCWAPLAALVMTVSMLPTFLAAERFGLDPLVAGLLLSMLGLSLVARTLENRTLVEDPSHDPADVLPAPLRWIPFGYVLNMGTAWALSQATVEGFGSRRYWEVTPKGPQEALPRASRIPLAMRGTLAVVALSAVLGGISLASGRLLTTFFYGTLGLGSAWVGGALWLEGLRSKRPGS